ncbi:phage major capsid protein [Acetobacter sp.]|jgi:HK97 family phage major capsid protein|uniref:phage major capsid protein n=1 Tax=Acetobacter sp. TaxID=440 RepID=UPI0025C5C8D7|nr:phage major capsid protein [Acetobacter sp.]MCH4091078.1 phage major capsid protein [Acetobacter sp.]MCI1300261.1 phage major capsid protein [Acetobacter sp.]MCI1316071.1 phage major capsid protein [Acetobacter sp.]
MAVAERTLSDVLADMEAIQGKAGPEINKRWEQLEAEGATLKAQETRQRTMDYLARSAPGTPLSADQRYQEARNGFTVVDAIRAQLPGVTDIRTGRARELSTEIERRTGQKPQQGGLLVDLTPAVETRATLTTGAQGTTGEAASLIPTQQRPDQFVSLLRARLITQQLGAGVLEGLTGNIGIPRQTAAAQAAWVGENQPLPSGNGTYDGIVMTPKTCGSIVEISRNTLMLSSPSAQELVQADLLAVMAQALDAAAIAGDGTGFTPKGVIPQAGKTTDYTAGALTWSEILACLTDLETANAVPNGWAVGAGVRAALMATPKAASVGAGFVMEDGTLAGLPAQWSTNVPAGTLVLGDWSNLLIGLWGVAEILVNPYASEAYQRGNVQVRVIQSADVAVRRSQAFTVLTPKAGT